MTSPHEGRSYARRSELIEGRYRTDFVLRCAGCGLEETIHMDPTCPPALVIRKFVRKGWAANERNASGCYCPACLKGEKPKMSTKAELPAGPTHDQLKRIAAHLRGVFEPEAGHYLDGQTDHSAADALGVPWGWVRQVRELLGFEIRVDPEIKALRDDLAALSEMAIALARKLDAVEKRRLDRRTA